MLKVIAILKFVFAFLLASVVIIGLNAAFKPSAGFLIFIPALLSFILIGGAYCYYLILTGIWNFKNKQYTVKMLPVIGLIIHLISVIAMVLYSSSINLPQGQKWNILVTSFPFFMTGLGFGIYDAGLFYKSLVK